MRVERQITLGTTTTESLLLFRVDRPLDDGELENLFLGNSPFEVDPGRRHANAAGWPYGNLVQNGRGLQIFGFDAAYYDIDTWQDLVSAFAPKIGAIVVGGVSKVPTELNRPYF